MTRARWIGAAAAFVAAVAVLAQIPHGPARAEAAPDRIVVNGRDAGRTFDGVGAVSASSSRLLYDYPEPERSQILDYLFRPHYGASLQILKVEIGSDANSTVVAEPSHERTRGAVDCGRGVEWWLMKQAKKRDPHIRLFGLMWGAPGWLRGGWWSTDQIHYLRSWLGCARRNGLRIDYLGGANEPRGAPAGFFVRLKRALAHRYPRVRVVATDEFRRTLRWYQAGRMAADPPYDAAVAVLGEHDVCGWGTRYQHCAVTRTARDLGKPLWNSEQSSQDVMSGAGPLARAMNRDYIGARLTGNLNWSPVAAYYDDTDTGGTGMIAAQWPWSGYYEVGPSVWVDAQTTQFTRPGWRYLDRACGYLRGGGSYVSLRAPAGGAYTVVIETMDARRTQNLQIVPAGGLSTGAAHVWFTAVRSTRARDWFARRGTLRPGRHGYTLRVPPGRVITVSTTTGQHRGTARPRASAPGTAPLPYDQDFDAVRTGRTAPWFADVSGGFESRPCPHRRGHCYAQVVTRRPYLWHGGGRLPVTLTGDPDWPGDYRVSVRAHAGVPVELLGRVDKYNARMVTGYHLRLTPSGTWRLYSETGTGQQITLATGHVPSVPGTVRRNAAGRRAPVRGAAGRSTSGPDAVGQAAVRAGAAGRAVSGRSPVARGAVGQDAAGRRAAGRRPGGRDAWHRLGLWFRGDRIRAFVDGRRVAAVTDDRHTTGQVGLAVGGWAAAAFDDLAVHRTAPAPRVVTPVATTASSAEPGLVAGHVYGPGEARDYRTATWWRSRPGAPGPQSITADLGRVRTTYGLSTGRR